MLYYTANILKKFKDEINNFYTMSKDQKENFFFSIYGEIPIAKELHNVGGELTKAFLSIGIDPLRYIPFVPDWYLYGVKDFTNAIIIPKNVDEINDEAFAYSGISGISFHDGFDRMHFGAFKGCDNLNLIKLPPLVQVIPQDCFRECKNLKAVVLPKDLTYIEDGAFAGCVSLEHIQYPGTMDEFWGDKVSLERGWKANTPKLVNIVCRDGLINPHSLV